jgi:predicted nucleotidyltransferase
MRGPPNKISTEDPDLIDIFNRVLGETVEAMEASGLRYVFIGGIASGGLGRPRSTHDIDLFVMPEDADLSLRALTKNGFSTQKTDPSWLYKAWKNDILVDVIFKSKGEIYLDNEMYQRVTLADFHGQRLRLVAPEDLFIIKAAAHSELTPGHWHDAIALLTHAKIDWEYLLRRARRAPRRTLSLLVYAQSVDVFVPNSVIHDLYFSIFNDISRDELGARFLAPTKSSTSSHSQRAERPVEKSNVRVIRGEKDLTGVSLGLKRTYGVAHLREALAEDSRTNELDIQIEHCNGVLLLRGEVAMDDRRKAVEQIAGELFPDCRIENQIRVQVISQPREAEEIQ